MKTLRSLGYAWNGLKYAFTTQSNFKIHLSLAILAVLLGSGLHISKTEWLAIWLCFAVVLLTELINTAIEKLCDVVQPDIHPGIKQVKDTSAAAVLISAAISAVVGAIIFIPGIIHLIKSI